MSQLRCTGLRAGAFLRSVASQSLLVALSTVTFTNDRHLVDKSRTIGAVQTNLQSQTSLESNQINLFRQAQTKFTERDNIEVIKAFILCVTGSTQGA